MSDGPPTHEIDPNRVRVEGREELDAVALSASLTDRTIQVSVRTGAVGSRDIELSYDDVEAVAAAQELSYALVVETDDAEYTITNITASREEITEIVEFVRGRMRSTGADGSQANGAASGASASDDGGSTSAADELQKWVELNEQGVITDAELEEKKEELL